ncbi:hypothetical protein [Streptomyces poonensis]|nr:hypothetical protein [Streptomyces poonensis]
MLVLDSAALHLTASGLDDTLSDRIRSAMLLYAAGHDLHGSPRTRRIR